MTIPITSPPRRPTPARNPRRGRRPSIRAFTEIGKTGLVRYGDQVWDELHKKLIGDKALKQFDEMQRNDATVGAVLFAIKMLIRQVDWRIDPGDDKNAENVKAADLIDTSLHDMSYTFADTLTEILSMLPFGFAYQEVLYKRRQGQRGLIATGQSSRYNDGQVGWRKWAPRAQLTRFGWEFDEDGGINAMLQMAAPDFQVTPIPIENSLLFRPEINKNNPEGRSILRNAYRSWYFLKTIETTEAIGVEREMAGTPVVTMPSTFMQTQGPHAAVFASYQKIARQAKANEQGGLVFPSDRDENGNLLYEFQLLKNEGRRAIDTNAIIVRHQRKIAQVVLADFLEFGGDKTGSQALGRDRRGLFTTAIDSYATAIEDIINKYAIPRLLGLNGYTLETLPELKHGEIDAPNMNEFAEVVGKLTGAGMELFPDEEIENVIRRRMYLPELTEEDIEERERAAEEERKETQEAARAELDRARADAERMRSGVQTELLPDEGS